MSVLTEATPGFSAFAVVALAGVGVFVAIGVVLLLRGRRQTGPIGGGEDQDVSRRIDTLEVQLASLPDRQEVGQLQQMVSTVQAQLATVTEGMRRQDRMLELVMQTLLERDNPSCQSASD